MEDLIVEGIKENGCLKEGISRVRQFFFERDHELRTEKHFADIDRGSAGKRINIFIRKIQVAY